MAQEDSGGGTGRLAALMTRLDVLERRLDRIDDALSALWDRAIWMAREPAGPEGKAGARTPRGPGG